MPGCSVVQCLAEQLHLPMSHLEKRQLWNQTWCQETHAGYRHHHQSRARMASWGSCAARWNWCHDPLFPGARSADDGEG
jgi:hypothetical protein